MRSTARSGSCALHTKLLRYFCPGNYCYWLKSFLKCESQMKDKIHNSLHFLIPLVRRSPVPGVRNYARTKAPFPPANHSEVLVPCLVSTRPSLGFTVACEQSFRKASNYPAMVRVMLGPYSAGIQESSEVKFLHRSIQISARR